MELPWPCVVAAVTAALVLLTGPHAVTGHQPAGSVTGETGSTAPVPPPPPSWSECTDLAMAALRPPVRHSLGDAVEEGAPSTAGAPLRGPSPGSRGHIAQTRARLTSLAAAACGGTPQPTLVFTTVGGFGDRLKGMVTAFYVALLTHAEFRVSWTVPSPLAPYFDVEPALLWADDGDGNGIQPPHDANTATPDFDPFATHLVIPGANAVDAIDIRAFFTDPANDFVARLAPPANGAVTLLRTNVPTWLEVVRHPSLRGAAALYGLTDLSRRDLFVLAVQAVLRRPLPVVVDAVTSVLPHPLHAAVGRSMAFGFGGGGGGGSGGDGATGEAGRRYPPEGSVARPPRRRGAAPVPVHLAGPDTAPSSASLDGDVPPPVPAFIGVQIRTGGVGEAWNDSEHRHPVDSARCFAAQAKAWCANVYGGHCVVFLTADSRAATRAFVAAFNGTGIAVRQTSGLFLHTDRGVPATAHRGAAARTRGAPTDPWLKTYADWAALSQADVLLMSHSGYGLTAAWTGGVPHVRQLHKGGECEWTRLDD